MPLRHSSHLFTMAPVAYPGVWVRVSRVLRNLCLPCSKHLCLDVPFLRGSEDHFGIQRHRLDHGIVLSNCNVYYPWCLLLTIAVVCFLPAHRLRGVFRRPFAARQAPQASAVQAHRTRAQEARRAVLCRICMMIHLFAVVIRRCRPPRHRWRLFLPYRQIRTAAVRRPGIVRQGRSAA